MARLDQTNRTRSTKPRSDEANTRPVFRHISTRQSQPRNRLTDQAPGRIWNVKSKNTTQYTLFILGVVVVILSIIQMKGG